MVTKKAMPQKQALSWKSFAAPLLVLAVVASLLFTMLTSRPKSDHPGETPGSYVYEPARALNSDNLIDHNGKPFDLGDWQGRWLLVNFGYLSCPDVCPIALGVLQGVLSPPDARERYASLTVLHVTVDPARDSAELMKAYLAYFGDYFLGITGPEEDIQHFARQLNAVFVKQEPLAGDSFYTVSHSSSVALVNPEGKFVAMLKGPESQEKLEQFLAEHLP